jgi:outer membrane beta-barrel protein
MTKFHTTIALAGLLATGAYAADLESELNGLALPSDQGVANVSQDKLYAVQMRHAPLKNRHELGFTGGKNLNQDGTLESNQWGGLYRFHINDKWAVGLNHFRMTNELSASGKRQLEQTGTVADKDFIENQTDLMAEYNLFYGKIRTGSDSVLYFDQYWGLGVGQVQMGRGSATAAVVDAGLAFWISKWGSARVGLKNDFYSEKTLTGSSSNTYNMIGYMAFGILLGGEG